MVAVGRILPAAYTAFIATSKDPLQNPLYKTTLSKEPLFLQPASNFFISGSADVTNQLRNVANIKIPPVSHSGSEMLISQTGSTMVFESIYDNLVLQISHKDISKLQQTMAATNTLGHCAIITTDATMSGKRPMDRKTDTQSSSGIAALHLGPAATTILHSPNAGGGSLLSEAFSAEVLTRIVFPHASLIATEMDIAYSKPDSPKADYVLEWSTHRLAVSVTRAFGYNQRTGDATGEFVLARAKQLMAKKLNGIKHARLNMNIKGVHQSVLHVLVPDRDIKRLCLVAWSQINRGGRACLADNTILVVTIVKEGWVYANQKNMMGNLEK
jgi:hypothetical protein